MPIHPTYFEDKLPTKKDADPEGKIWVFRVPSMTSWDKLGYWWKIPLDDYIEPLKTELKHFINSDNRKLSKLSYTDKSSKAYYNRVLNPYWFPGVEIRDMSKISRLVECRNLALENGKFPVFDGHLSEKDYNTLCRIYNRNIHQGE